MADSDYKQLPRQVKDIRGKPFGRWTVLSYAGTDKHRQATWECVCECGRTGIVTGFALRNGRSQSCGCLKLEQLIVRSTTHGQTNNAAYSSWRAMIRRCYDSSHHSFHNYGGRSISVCKRWRASPNAFIADMGERPSEKHSVERIDNSGHYSCGKCDECVANDWPSNCKWATEQEQKRNTRRNHMLTHNGHTMCITDWAKHTGIPVNSLRKRLQLGWAIAKTLTQTVRNLNRSKS